ncbi:MAG: polysaccharide pyruvyl transferase, partial [Elusimicrobia bacterium RIFOXYB2_FULL_50_12]
MVNPIKLYRVGISGSYGGLNLGDEAILQCIITQLKNSLPVEITVFSRDAQETMRLHQVDRVVAVRRLSREEIVPDVQRLDLFILGGGGILFDGEARTFLREVAIAHEHGIPVMIYSVGAGPLDDPKTQELVRDNLNRARLITVRERSARKALEEAGVSKEIIVTSDPALLLQPEAVPANVLETEGVKKRRRLIGISVREPGMAAPGLKEESYHSLLANAADFMVERLDADIVFIPMERKSLDLQHAHAVMAQMLKTEHATVLKGNYTPGQILSLMKRFDFAVGMRLHFLIFAALQGVPFVALPYAAKVYGFLEDLEIESPPLHLINAGRLIAHIDSLWDNRSSLVAKTELLLPALQKRARHNNTLAVELLLKGRIRK